MIGTADRGESLDSALLQLYLTDFCLYMIFSSCWWGRGVLREVTHGEFILVYCYQYAYNLSLTFSII